MEVQIKCLDGLEIGHACDFTQGHRQRVRPNTRVIDLLASLHLPGDKVKRVTVNGSAAPWNQMLHHGDQLVLMSSDPK